MRDVNKILIRVASPEDIISWSRGEVIKPETLNYRTQRPEKDGLFSERIFGPTKDYECYCGKYKKARYKGIVCEKCGVEVTRSNVRRERMGHIELASPVVHIWFLKTVPSRLSLLLDVPMAKLERVIYYAAYIVTSVNDENKKKAMDSLRKDFEKSSAGEEKESENKLKNLEDTLKSLRPGTVLSEAEYFKLSEMFGEVFEADRGAGAVRKILEQLDCKKMAEKISEEITKVKDESRKKRMLRRIKLFRSLLESKIKPEWMVLTILPVLPPDLRPMVALEGGRYATADLNDLYRRVINRNNRLKKLIDLKAPDVIMTNEKRMLQEAVDALIDNSSRSGSQILSNKNRPLRSLADMLRGKQGRFRQNLLGKRVDYSGRSVIVVGPELMVNECGLPKIMALELFRHFVINRVIELGFAYNIKQANRFIEQGSDEVWRILEEVVAKKRVLLNRAPTLHRLGIQAFKPKLIEDLSIRISPLVCTAFNADFDGDMMAVHLPLTLEAQYEARELMDASKNLLKPASGDPIVTPTQDIVLGVYYLTTINEVPDDEIKIFPGPEEVAMAVEMEKIDLNEKIKVKIEKGKDKGKIIETSYGRIIFNDVLPENFDFFNEKINKKKLSNIVSKIVESHSIEESSRYINNIKNLGFEYSTISATSWGMEDSEGPVEKKKEIVNESIKKAREVEDHFEEGLLTSHERYERLIEIWTKAKADVSKFVSTHLGPGNPIHRIIDSKARGSWDSGDQMVGMRGLVNNPQNITIELPVISSYDEGLDILEYFISTHGARKGLTDTALKTAHAGYLTRRMVDVSQEIIVQEEDCKVRQGIEIRREDSDEYGADFGERVFSRTTLEEIKVGDKVLVKSGEVINRQASSLIGESGINSIKVRTPIKCKTYLGICKKCYGWDLAKEKEVEIGEAVGVVAAQSIGEPGTQLTMRTFHIGGIAGVDITHGLPRVEEIFEGRPPKGKAPLIKSDGVVKEIEPKGLINIVRVQPDKVKSGRKSLNEYTIPRGIKILIKKGDKVKKGDQVSEGPLDPKEILSYRGSEEVERYIVNEVQKIYGPEGSSINDKHIEIIVRQMLSRVMLTDAGDSKYTPGDLVERTELEMINEELKKQGKKLAKGDQKVLGVTTVALNSMSFLSAASFQETNRVLVSAGIEGKADNLRGLKENVIIGRLIPAGTGKRSIPKEKIDEIKELFEEQKERSDMVAGETLESEVEE